MGSDFLGNLLRNKYCNKNQKKGLRERRNQWINALFFRKTRIEADRIDFSITKLGYSDQKSKVLVERPQEGEIGKSR